MRNPLSLLLLVLLYCIVPNRLKACDVCGSFIGVYPSDKKAFVSLFYRYGSFSENNTKYSSFLPDGGMRVAHGNNNDEHNNKDAYEVYRAAELRARFYVHSRIEISVIAPYVFNAAFENGRNVNLDGIGDVTTMLGWQIMDEKTTGVFKHRLLLGAGIKWASGNINRKVNDERVSILLQPGTGSTDGVFFANYQMGVENWSWNALPTFKLNGTNTRGEHVTNSYTMFSSVNYQWTKTDNFKGLFSAQGFFESMNGILINEKKVAGTSMKGIFIGPGVDLFYKNVGFNTSCWWNVYDKNANLLASRIRYRVGLSWYFNQQSFLVK